MTNTETEIEQFPSEEERRHARRLAMARIVLQGAANETSRRLALQLFAPWFTDETQQALTEMAQEAETV